MIQGMMGGSGLHRPFETGVMPAGRRASSSGAGFYPSNHPVPHEVSRELMVCLATACRK